MLLKASKKLTVAQHAIEDLKDDVYGRWRALILEMTELKKGFKVTPT